MKEPTVNPRVAAKARASILEEGEAGFDMGCWYDVCNTTACLAGHIVLSAGKNAHEEDNMTWPVQAFKELFSTYSVPNRTCTWSELDGLFHKVGLTPKEVIEEFDAFIKKHLPEDVTYQNYLHISYGYQGYYRRLRNQS